MITVSDLTWWLELAPTLKWRGAKTYEKTAPHGYVVRDKDLPSPDFDRAVAVIRTFGEPGKFWAGTQVYLVDGTTKWWTMKGTIAEQGVINSAAADVWYGEQNAPRTASSAFTVYDQIATEYDGKYAAQLHGRSALVARMISGSFGAYAPSTLDVGCGTGHLLDLGPVSARNYIGIDPSQGMLNQLVLKYPQVSGLLPGTAHQNLHTFVESGMKFDLVCALFGSASYLDPVDWETMLGLSKRQLLLMTYAEGYLPDYCHDQLDLLMEFGASRRQLGVFAQTYGAESYPLGDFDLVVIEK